MDFFSFFVFFSFFALTELCECLRKLLKLNLWAKLSGDSGDCGPEIVRIGILKALSKIDRFLLGFSTASTGNEWTIGFFTFSSLSDVSSSECGRETFILGAWSCRTSACTLTYCCEFSTLNKITRKDARDFRGFVNNCDALWDESWLGILPHAPLTSVAYSNETFFPF